MAKEIKAKIKLQCPAGQATPAPPVGPALGAHGVNIGQFVKEFNDRTRDRMGLIIPVEITVYKDRSFDFILKSPPAAVLLKKLAGLEKASGTVGHETVGSVTRAQVEEIFELPWYHPTLSEVILNVARDLQAERSRLAGRS